MSPFALPRQTRWIVLALVLGVGAVFWPVLGHDFVHYDDPLYVTANPQVQAGLTWQGIQWAFDRLVGNQTYWHPLTWLSHMLDWQLFGNRPAGHHAVSLLLHLVNTLLVFGLLRHWTQRPFRSACVAALFALHPLQVDTVAWVAERKNLLATLCGLLALGAYGQYARARQAGAAFRQTMPVYLLAGLLFAAGLMCKSPLLVTLPCIFLLLDLWPFQRIPTPLAPRPLLGLVLEKIPFFLLSAASSAVTWLAHKQLNLIFAGEALPLWERLGNGFVAYIRYLSEIFWPAGLAVYYPPAHFTGLQIGAAVAGIVVVSGLAGWRWRSAPWFFMGWFWFLGSLVPFVGFVQAGVQSIADRFAYFPLIGFFTALVWGVAEFFSRWTKTEPLPEASPEAAPARPGLSPVCLALAAAAILACGWTSRQQLAHWKNTETLFRHAVAVTKNNWVAHVNLGSTLQETGRMREAAEQYRLAAAANPTAWEPPYYLAQVLVKIGPAPEAGEHYVTAIALAPGNAQIFSDYGNWLLSAQRREEAAAAFMEAIRLNPQFASAYYNYGILCTDENRPNAAINAYEKAISFQPDFADAHNNLALVLADQGKFDAAADHLRQTLRLRPDDAETHFNLSYVLGKLGRTEESAQERATALRLRPDLLKK